ncbi:hypothetical protein F4814DRAFT_46924 [Daldinia grandis]|nr:hypothetical protein F4814DRAFT_46924 [Daldinia grandis]
MVRVGVTHCPVIETPQPPVGHRYGNTPSLKDVPAHRGGVAALRVCHQSRMIALKHLVLLSKPLPGPRHTVCSYISTHDIIDASIFPVLEESGIYVARCCRHSLLVP